MKRIDKIVLENVLPVVFSGSEKDEPIASSEVWMQSMEFVRGNFYLVEAESGTGKSSLCAYIYGNRRDYHGKIFFDGRDIRDFSVADWCEIRRRHLAYLPQEMRLFPELTVLENIEIKNRLTDTYSESEIVKMLGLLEVDNKLKTIAGRLSVGQQQRVAIVRALCQPFDFLLLDEPVSHLDERNNVTVARLVEGITEERAASIVTTSVGNPLLLGRNESKRIPISIKL